MILQLLAIFCCSISLLCDKILEKLDSGSLIGQIIQGTYDISIYIFLLFFIGSWIYLCRVFYIIFGSLYHLRKKRFIKYTKPIAWFYEKFVHKSFYEKNFRERGLISFNAFNGIDSQNLQKIKNGGTILVLYHDDACYSNFILNYIKETIQDGETVDFITTYKNPIEICREFPDSDIPKITRRLSIIDCFSSQYAFDDKVVKYAKQDYSQKGFRFYNADSFAEIHTAANNSWYRFRKLCKSEENAYRIPHRTIYDTLSSLINFSSEELYFLFLRHVLSSEKSYGMISTIIEPYSLKCELKSDLIRMADIVLEYKNNSFQIIK